MMFCASMAEAASAPQTAGPIPLWSGAAPGAVGDGEGHTPRIDCYPASPKFATGAAIVICPGGGYGGLAWDYEGRDVAQWFASQGVAAFVLTYRHAPNYRHPIPLGDAQRAIRTVRARAEEWKLDPSRIGILGFSAGGHLAATSGTIFDAGDAKAPDPIDRVSCRPDFLVLIYPVITMTEDFGHQGSKDNLLGSNAPDELARSVSPEKNATKDTPPAFLISTWEDEGVPAQNSLVFFQALKAAGVPAEMHVYEKGPHGFGMGVNDPVLSTWPAHCMAWLKTRGIVK